MGKPTTINPKKLKILSEIREDFEEYEKWLIGKRDGTEIKPNDFDLTPREEVDFMIEMITQWRQMLGA